VQTAKKGKMVRATAMHQIIAQGGGDSMKNREAGKEKKNVKTKDQKGE